MPVSFADKRRRFPRTTSDTPLDSGDRSCPRPCKAPNGQLARRDFLVPTGLRDQGPHPLQCHGLPYHLTSSVPLVDISFGLEVTAERRPDELDLGQPLDRGDPVPARNDQPQWVTMLDGQWLAIHRISQ